MVKFFPPKKISFLVSTLRFAFFAFLVFWRNEDFTREKGGVPAVYSTTFPAETPTSRVKFLFPQKTKKAKNQIKTKKPKTCYHISLVVRKFSRSCARATWREFLHSRGYMVASEMRRRYFFWWRVEQWTFLVEGLRRRKGCFAFCGFAFAEINCGRNLLNA